MALGKGLRGLNSLQLSPECELFKSLFLGAAMAVGVRLLGFHPRCGTSGGCLNLSEPQAPLLTGEVSNGCCLPLRVRIPQGAV